MYQTKNADRFTGFAEIYNNARPTCPQYVIDTLLRYLGHRPNTVIDLGCGTGLSTAIWSNYADRIIGIEPSDDMRNIAIANIKNGENISFIKGFSDNTGLDDERADIITCSQSFHWMEPISTLKEVNRLLKPGGIFAVYDYDYPPVFTPLVDLICEKLKEKQYQIESENKEFNDSFIRYPKNNHLNNIGTSGYFKYVREIVFASTEKADAERYFNIIISQGGVQAIIKKEPALLEKDLNEFKQAVQLYFGNKILDIDFCYRMRIGVK